MTLPLVSVGMPLYNGEKTLRRALDGILAQDYQNIEIIISQNCSIDNTQSIIEEYKHKSNIVIYEQPKTLPIIENFTYVLNKARGEYFMWAAADDCWEPTFISSLVAKLESDNRFAVAQSATLTVSESDLDKIGYIRFSGPNNPENCSMLQLTKKIVSPLKYNFYIYGLFRRKLLKEAFEFVPRIPSSDRWFLLQFPLAGYKFAYVDEPLYIRTIANAPLYERYPDEPLAEKVKDKRIKSTWFQFEPVWIVRDMLYKSSLVKRKSLFNILMVLLQIALRRLKVGFKLLASSMVVYLLPAKFLNSIKTKVKVKSAKIVYGEDRWE